MKVGYKKKLELLGYRW